MFRIKSKGDKIITVRPKMHVRVTVREGCAPLRGANVTSSVARKAVGEWEGGGDMLRHQLRSCNRAQEELATQSPTRKEEAGRQRGRQGVRLLLCQQLRTLRGRGLSRAPYLESDLHTALTFVCAVHSPLSFR